MQELILEILRVLLRSGRTLFARSTSIIIIVFKFVKQYRSKFEQANSFIKIFEMWEPFILNNVYVPMEFLTGNSSENRQSSIEIVRDTKHLIVLGQPGTGKSTYLKYVGLESLRGKEGNFGHRVIPVFVDVQRLKMPDNNIFNMIEKKFIDAQFLYPREFTQTALEQGNLLILIDGIDLIPEKQESNEYNRQQGINHIQDFIDRYGQNRFILSCRTQYRHIYRHRFSSFKERELANFNDRQIQDFICRWFNFPQNLDPIAGNNLWRLLQTTTNEKARNLARIPLYLAYICIQYQYLSPTDGNFLDDLDFTQAFQMWELSRSNSET
jgi:predicted NACHT family NTPase